MNAGHSGDSDGLCGCSALQGRLIYESEASEEWSKEIVALLEENKHSVLGGLGEQSVGFHICGSSVKQTDPEAQKLFYAMSVVPEDVPAPMCALELIWCSASGDGPPLGRLGMIQLRRRVFTVRWRLAFFSC